MRVLRYAVRTPHDLYVFTSRGAAQAAARTTPQSTLILHMVGEPDRPLHLSPAQTRFLRDMLASGRSERPEGYGRTAGSATSAWERTSWSLAKLGLVAHVARLRVVFTLRGLVVAADLPEVGRRKREHSREAHPFAGQE